MIHNSIKISAPPLDRDLGNEQKKKQFVKGIVSQFSVVSPEEDAENDRRIAEYEHRIHEEKCEYNFRKSCSLDKFLNVELSELGELENVVFGKKSERATMNIFEDYIKDVTSGKPSMLWLCGNPGTGKTTLAMAVMHELCRKGIPCGYFKSHKIMQRLKDTERYSSRILPEDIISDACSYDFSIFDEIGRWPVPEWEKFRIFEICNELYEHYRSGIFISNMSGAEFAGFIGSAATDRFRGMCLILEFKGDSLRGTEKELYTGHTE